MTSSRPGCLLLLLIACTAEVDVIIDDADDYEENAIETDDGVVVTTALTLEAESMTLRGYAVENEHIALSVDTGSSVQHVDGAGRTYQLKIHAIGEAAGAPLLDVVIDGVPVASFRYPRVDGATEFSVDSVMLTSSSVVELVGHRDEGAHAIIDRVEIVPLDVTSIEAVASGSCTARNATLTHRVSFDTPELAGVKEKLYPGGTIAFTTQTRRDGAGAVRMRVGSPKLSTAQCSLGRYRAEMVTTPVDQYGWDDGKTYWIGLSMNPTNFEGSAYTLLQIHAPNEGKDDPCDYAGNALSINPMLINGVEHYALRVIENGGRSTVGAGSGQKRVWTEPMRKNRWTDFVVSFSLSTKGRGFFHVWRNGQLIYTKSGLTNVNYIDSCGRPVPADKRAHNGPHFGIYGPSCSAHAPAGSHFREVVMDELRTATGPNGFGVVSPSCF